MSRYLITALKLSKKAVVVGVNYYVLSVVLSDLGKRAKRAASKKTTKVRNNEEA